MATTIDILTKGGKQIARVAVDDRGQVTVSQIADGFQIFIQEPGEEPELRKPDSPEL